jgi:hypothetical protein
MEKSQIMIEYSNVITPNQAIRVDCAPVGIGYEAIKSEDCKSAWLQILAYRLASHPSTKTRPHISRSEAHETARRD